MTLYSEKKDVYAAVEQLRQTLNITDSNYPINVRKICESIPNMQIREVDFVTKGLRGAAFLAENDDENDVIILNSNRNFIEQNFDCGHELYHASFHREFSKSFQCLHEVKQNPYLEWQANIGSAELIVPYKLLLPIIKENVKDFKKWGDFLQFRIDTAMKFRVTQTVMMLRFEDLKYEIFQYLHGVEINDIEFLSERQQRDRGINIKSLNEAAEIKLEKPKKVSILVNACEDQYFE